MDASMRVLQEPGNLHSSLALHSLAKQQALHGRTPCKGSPGPGMLPQIYQDMHHTSGQLSNVCESCCCFDKATYLVGMLPAGKQGCVWHSPCTPGTAGTDLTFRTERTGINSTSCSDSLEPGLLALEVIPGLLQAGALPLGSVQVSIYVIHAAPTTSRLSSLRCNLSLPGRNLPGQPVQLQRDICPQAPSILSKRQ